MDGCSAKKSTSLEILVIQNISNINDLKEKLKEIVKAGKDYPYEVSSCLKSLLNNNDREIVLLAVTGISELVKCEEKRITYAQPDIIEPLLGVLKKDVNSDTIELIKQSCRSLGNLCCDCDESRKIVQDTDGIAIILNLLKSIQTNSDKKIEEIKILASKTLLNYAIGGQDFVKILVREGVIDVVHGILSFELEKDDMTDDLVVTALLVLNVIADNIPDIQYDSELNITVLNILRLTANIEISEYCLEHLHLQAEQEAVKTLLAEQGGVELVCSRLEQLLPRHVAGDLLADNTDVESVMKLACDLIIIVLTGDEAMRMLYDSGVGTVYTCMVRWLDSPVPLLLTTATLAMGNFARQDDYCIHMMASQIFDKLLDIFEVYNEKSIAQKLGKEDPDSIDAASIVKVQHAVLSAIRNLIVSAENKEMAAESGRAAPLLISALPHVKEFPIAYKLLAAIRMLVDKQESVAQLYMCDEAAIHATCEWRRGQHGAAGDEAARLLAWSLRTAPAHAPQLLQVDGSITNLVSMLVSSHTVMQNEAILALSLLSAHPVNTEAQQPNNSEAENNLIQQLVKSEIGKHLSVLIETNCAKMPLPVAENLITFLEMVANKNNVAFDLKEAKVDQSLDKFMNGRTDLIDNLKARFTKIIHTISQSNQMD